MMFNATSDIKLIAIHALHKFLKIDFHLNIFLDRTQINDPLSNKHNRESNIVTNKPKI